MPDFNIVPDARGRYLTLVSPIRGDLMTIDLHTMTDRTSKRAALEAAAETAIASLPAGQRGGYRLVLLRDDGTPQQVLR
jgi:hypothetical protein